MEFAFNELSEVNIQSSDDLDNFYKQLKKFMEITQADEFPRVVFTDDFASKNHNGLGCVYELTRESTLEHDEYQHFMSIVANSPYSYFVQDADAQYFYGDFQTKGMQYSCINDVRVVSIPGPNWGEYVYVVNKLFIDATSLNIVTTNHEIEHLGDLTDITGSWVQACLPVVTFNNAREFLANIPQKYPEVILSESAKESLAGFNQGKLNQLERAMSIFNDYCLTRWNTGFKKEVITQLGVSVKDETEITMKRYGTQRLFLNESGVNEIIPLHFNISEDFRGNIKPLPNKKIYIAYLGPHLSTSKYK